MLDQTLSVLVAELDKYLQFQSGESSRKQAMLSALTDQSGSQAFIEEELVVATLFNLEHDRTNLNAKAPRSGQKVNPPIQLNVYVLFSAIYPKNYLSALRAVHQVVAFFQGKQVFTAANTPGLPESVDKITAELYNLDQHNQSMLWGTLGAKYLPSVALKLRMISVSRDQVIATIPEITSTSTEAQK